MALPPVSDEETREYVEHILSCDQKLCGRYPHRWAKTEQGQRAVAEAMRADRDQARR